MVDKDPQPNAGHTQSGVLDAIFDVMGETSDAPVRQAGGIYRAQALEQIDVPKQIDNLLPLTSRRRWLVLVGAAILILAGIAYALGTTVVTSVSASGRAVSSPGITVAASPQDAVIASVSVTPGEHVSARQEISVATTADGSTTNVSSPIDGTVWQVLQAAGSVVARGTPVVTVLPDGPVANALVAVDERGAADVRAGQQVSLVAANGGEQPATVLAVASSPIPAADASARVGLSLPNGSAYVLVSVAAASPLTAGDSLSVVIVTSQQTLAQRLVSGL